MASKKINHNNPYNLSYQINSLQFTETVQTVVVNYCNIRNVLFRLLVNDCWLSDCDRNLWALLPQNK